MLVRIIRLAGISLFIAATILIGLYQGSGERRVIAEPGINQLVTYIDKEADAGDQPGEAAEFYRFKRAPNGTGAVPAERYLAAVERTKRMPRYSTALNAFLTAENRSLSSAAEPAALGTWVSLGPGNIGGRTRALLVNPQNPEIMFAAGVSGGVWKSTNAGASWSPLSDLLPNLAVCSMAFETNNPSTIYAGTGEGVFGGTVNRGAGIFKTTDAGASWVHLGSTSVPDFQYVNDIVVSPNDARRVYAGTSTGIWRSGDGGATWTRVLVPQNSGGCLDLAIRTDQQTDYIFASCGNFSQAVVYRNTDAGSSSSWAPVLTEANMGRTSLAIAPSDQNIIYALAASNAPGLYNQGLLAVFRSTSGGGPDSWTAQVRNTDPRILNTVLLSSLDLVCGRPNHTSQGWYDNVIAVDPADPEIVWAGGLFMLRSDDGGANWNLTFNIHIDQHVIVFHPQYNGSTNKIMFAGNDGGIYRTDDARATTVTITAGTPCFLSDLGKLIWTPLNNNYGVTQFYHGSVYPDGKSYIGGTQDNGLVKGTDAGGVDGWRLVLAGDGGYSAVDADNPNIVYGESHGLVISKSTDGGLTFRLATNGITEPAGGFLFIVPFVMDPTNSQRLWTGGTVMWRTNDGAANWSQASSALMTSVVSAIAVAPSNPNVVLAGTAGGSIHRTNVGLTSAPDTAWSFSQPRGGFVSWITIHPENPNVAYATYSSFNVQSTDRHIYKSTDGGATWRAIDGSGAAAIPDIPVHSIVVDPTNTSRLYVGTDLGIFVSLDNGISWARENTGFANVITESLALNSAEGVVQLFAFTHGRGAWRVRLAQDFSPRISNVSVQGKKLIVNGENFDIGAVILVNGQSQNTKNDTQNPKTTLISKKAGKKIKPGQTVTVQVRNAGGAVTPVINFTRQ